MERRYYSVFDVLAKEFGDLCYCKNDSVASRMFKQIVEKNNLNPKEFELYLIGKMDDETGKFVSAHPEVVGPIPVVLGEEEEEIEE